MYHYCYCYYTMISMHLLTQTLEVGIIFPFTNEESDAQGAQNTDSYTAADPGWSAIDPEPTATISKRDLLPPDRSIPEESACLHVEHLMWTWLWGPTALLPACRPPLLSNTYSDCLRVSESCLESQTSWMGYDFPTCPPRCLPCGWALPLSLFSCVWMGLLGCDLNPRWPLPRHQIWMLLSRFNVLSINAGLDQTGAGHILSYLMTEGPPVFMANKILCSTWQSCWDVWGVKGWLCFFLYQLPDGPYELPDGEGWVMRRESGLMLR